jgi:hypothetical protein
LVGAGRLEPWPKLAKSVNAIVGKKKRKKLIKEINGEEMKK